MKDEEMAEEYAQNLEKELMKEYEEHSEYGQTPYLATIPTPHVKQAFIAGLKAGRPQWHKVTDKLPPFDKKVLVRVGENTLIGLRDSSDKCWCVGDFFDTILSDRHIIAWCEIPTFDKE